MKNWILYLTIFLFQLSHSIAQLDGLGVLVGNNFSTQFYKEISPSENYHLGSNWIQGLNIGIYGVKKISTKWEIRSSLNFQQKGRTEEAYSNQIAILSSNPTLNKLENKLSYLTLGVYFDHILNPESKKLKISPFLGLENNFFVGERIIEGELHRTFSFYPRNEYEGKWNSYYLSYSLGFRFRLYDLIGITTFLNNSASAALRTKDLEVNNYTIGITLDVDVLSIIKK